MTELRKIVIDGADAFDSLTQRLIRHLRDEIFDRKKEREIMQSNVVKVE